MATATLENINIPFTFPFIKDLQKNWGWFLALGILSILAGFVAISAPLATALTIELFVGWLLIFSGIFQTVQAVKCRKRKGFAAALLLGVLTFVAGLVFLFSPFKGVMTITLMLGIFFLIQGVIKSIGAFQLKPMEGWGWLLFTGIIEFLFGILIWSRWPSSATWLIGLLVGIDLIFIGWSMITLSLFSRKLKAVKTPDVPA